jgi:hypothetical protein
LQANIKKHIRRWQFARAYHTTDHYHKNLSLRPWSKLGKCSLNKSINLFGSVLSLMCGWSKLGKCLICLFLMCGWAKREHIFNGNGKLFSHVLFSLGIQRISSLFLSFHICMPR